MTLNRSADKTYILMNQVQDKKKETKLLKKITEKIKHGLVLDSICNQLVRIGIKITPYYWVQEGINPCEVPEIYGILSDYTTEFIGPEEIKEITEDMGTYSVEGLLAYYNAGKKCLGLKYKGKLASFMFINLTECDFTPQIITLKNDEAYLVYMYTMKAFRGKNLAPYLRYKSYDILKKMGRNKIYSVSAFFNSSAVRYKEKLNAKNLKLALYIEIFKKIRWKFNLKTF